MSSDYPGTFNLLTSEVNPAFNDLKFRLSVGAVNAKFRHVNNQLVPDSLQHDLVGLLSDMHKEFARNIEAKTPQNLFDFVCKTYARLCRYGPNVQNAAERFILDIFRSSLLDSFDKEEVIQIMKNNIDWIMYYENAKTERESLEQDIKKLLAEKQQVQKDVLAKKVELSHMKMRNKIANGIDAILGKIFP